ncbi:R8 protein [Colletotrichum tropicale]|nr:R8 protein [Colletotrichum tropicale]
MFYSHEILNNKQYGVATIWHIANFGQSNSLKRVTRKVIDDVKISKACAKFMDPGPPIALRTQSKLLFGTVRVFERQCYYTLHDAEKVRQLMTDLFASIDNAIDMNAGKARREQITLSDDPSFVPSDKIPQFSLDSGDLLFPSQQKLASGSGKKSQSQLSPLKSPISIDFTGGGDPILDFDLSQSSSNAGFFPMASPFGRGAAADTFLPKARESLDMGMDMSFGAVLDDDDFGGLHMRVGPDGALIDDDEIELPILPGMEGPDDVPVQDQQPDPELPQYDQDQIMPDLEGDVPAEVPVLGSDPPLFPQDELSLQSNSPMPAKAAAPAKKKRPRVARPLEKDDENETAFPRAVIKKWQVDYVANTEAVKRDASAKKRKRETAAHAREYAKRLVLGNGIWGVGDPRGIVGITYPLAQIYAGDGLRDRIYGQPPAEENQADLFSTPRGRRRRSEEAFGEDESQRNVRPRLDETPHQGRSQEDIPQDFGMIYSDHSMPEMGMDAPQPMSEHMSPAILPWVGTPSVGRASLPPGSHSQRAARQTSLRGSSIPPFTPHQNDRSSDAGGGFSGIPGSDAAPSGLLDGIAQPNQDDSLWARSAMDVASQEFLHWTEEKVTETGYAKMGDTNENRLWVTFDNLCEPGQQDHTVAAQAFYHILSLATKNVVAVEQDIENLEPFGTIRVGVDMTGRLEGMD